MVKASNDRQIARGGPSKGVCLKTTTFKLSQGASIRNTTQDTKHGLFDLTETYRSCSPIRMRKIRCVS